MVTYTQWLNEFAYVGKGVTEGTMKDAMLHFFYRGVNPFIRDAGYRWLESDAIIANKFLKFCFLVYETSKMSLKYSLQTPMAMHRDFPEDRDTFDFILDTRSFVDFMEDWDFRTEIIGTRLEYLLREFCYVWINVESGKPGTMTQAVLTALLENDSDDDPSTILLPDGNWTRRKFDLY